MRPWLKKGDVAFRRSFPAMAALLDPSELYYVCPQCLQGFTVEAWQDGTITREHVPPESMGGQRLVLTCQACNNDLGGADSEGHMRLEADFCDFVSGKPVKAAVHLKTAGGRVPINLTAGGGNILAFGVPKAVHPGEQQRVVSSFDEATSEGRWEKFQMTFEFRPYSMSRAATGWLRTAYLAYFAALGYRFVLRHELNEVREKLSDPEGHCLKNFRMTGPTFRPDPILLRIDSPEPFRSFAMAYRHHTVFLARYGDRGLYDRLGAEAEHSQLEFQGVQYPWPTGGPTFFHDFA